MVKTEQNLMVETEGFRAQRVTRDRARSSLPDPTGPVNEIWSCYVVPRKSSMKRKEGSEIRRIGSGIKGSACGEEKREITSRGSGRVHPYISQSTGGFATVVKAKNGDVLNLDCPQGEKFAVRLFQAQYRTSLNRRVSKLLRVLKVGYYGNQSRSEKDGRNTSRNSRRRTPSSGAHEE